MSLTAQTPQPRFAWTFNSSNVDYVTGLTPSAQVSPGPAQLQGSAALVTNAPTSNTAVYFPGTTSTWMNLGTSTPVNFNTITSNIFMECWIYSSLAFNPSFIIWHQGSVGGQENWSLYFDTSGRLNLSTWGQVSGTPTQGGTGVGSAIPLNTWTHVGFAISNTNSVYTNYIYVNGVPTSTSTPANWVPQYNASGITQIGGRNVANDLTNMYIRDLRVVQGGIVPTSSFTPGAAPFSYSSPGYVANMGTSVFTLLGQFITYPIGKNGSAVSITNTAGGTPSSNVSWALPSISSSSFTVASWINATTFSSSNASQFIAMTGFNAESDFRLFFNSGTTSARIGTTYAFVTGVYNGVTTTPSYNTGTWNHVAVTVTESSLGSNVITFYVNGDLVGSSTSATSRPRTFTKFTIGSFCNGLFYQAYNGLIDDLRIYNTALTASQVQSVYRTQGMPSRIEFSNANSGLKCYFRKS